MNKKHKKYTNNLNNLKNINRSLIVAKATSKHRYYKFCKKIYFILLKHEINLLKKKFPNVDFYVEGRLKSLNSIIDKMIDHKLENKSTKIYDFLAVRYIIKSVNGNTDLAVTKSMCYKFMNYLMKNIPYTIELKSRRKDYIKNPKEDGYMALHGTRIHNISNPFFSEIQIKTEDMYSKHSLYKPVKISKSPDDIPDVFEFKYNKNGKCNFINSLSVEDSFEKYFDIPYLK